MGLADRLVEECRKYRILLSFGDVQENRKDTMFLTITDVPHQQYTDYYFTYKGTSIPFATVYASRYKDCRQELLTYALQGLFFFVQKENQLQAQFPAHLQSYVQEEHISLLPTSFLPIKKKLIYAEGDISSVLTSLQIREGN